MGRLLGTPEAQHLLEQKVIGRCLEKSFSEIFDELTPAIHEFSANRIFHG